MRGVLKRLRRRLSGGIPGLRIAKSSTGERADALESCTTISHIQRLPDELLIVVLEFAHADIFASSNVERFRTWLRLLNVCSHWRRVILSVSSLWRIAPISSDFRSLDMCVALHGSTPLEVFIHNPWLAFVSLPLLQPQISSVRFLSVRVPHMHPDQAPFRELLAVEMPCLEELQIFPGLVHPEIFGPPVLSIQAYPRLQRLEVQDLISPSNITNLRALKLSRCSWQLSFHDFVQTLDRCALLEELHLDQSLVSLSPSVPPVISRNMQHATLPRLRTLDIQDDNAGLITVLMTLIVAPVITSLRILCLPHRLVELDEQARTSDAEPIFRRLVPQTESILPKYPPDAGSVKASLSFMQDVCMFKVSSTQLPNPVLVDLAYRFDLLWTRMVAAALQDIAALFQDTPITELVVEASPNHVPPAVWEELFPSLPCLEKLELTGNGPWTAMWQGLQRASSIGELCCPRLRSVHIRHTSRTEDDCPAPPDERGLEIITDTLRGREEAGVKLEELIWAVYSLHHANYYASRGRFFARLAPFVECISYEDLGQCFDGHDSMIVSA